MSYRLIALDVDGTLVDDQHQISQRTKVALQTAWRAGYMIVLCTGRGPANTLPIWDELAIAGYMLNHNGGVVCHSQPFRVLAQSAFAVAEVQPIIEYCRRADVHFDLCTTNELYCETLTEYAQTMYGNFLIDPIAMEDSLTLVEPLVKLTLFGEVSQMDRVEAECQSLVPHLRMIRSDPRFIDFMLPNVTKGSALAALCEQYQITAAEVIAFGNYYNDVEMITFAGAGIAMANSPADVRLLADDVTLSNNEEGVYHGLVKYGIVSPE